VVKNKGVHCVTLALEIAEKIERVGQGKSFSAKMEYIVKEYCVQKQMLVDYNTEESRETGQPTIWLNGAERIWGCSPWLNGVEDKLAHTTAAEALDEWATNKKVARFKPQERAIELSKIMQDIGYIVQIVNIPESDITEVWIARKEQKPVCGECGVVDQLRKLLKALE